MRNHLQRNLVNNTHVDGNWDSARVHIKTINLLTADMYNCRMNKKNQTTNQMSLNMRMTLTSGDYTITTKPFW